MGESYHFYFNAATALWNMSLGELQAMSAEEGNDALRRAATRALQLKAAFMTPEEFSEERVAISKLASSLLADPDFTLDLALSVSGAPPAASDGPKRDRSRVTTIGQPRGRRWKVVLWVAVAAGSILLALDVLATAGVPVPTPIGELIDRFSSDNPPYLPPQPLNDKKDHLPSGPIAGDGDPVEAGSAIEGHEASVPRLRGARPSDKNERHANGRVEHQAQGRHANQANGKERLQANGTVRRPESGEDFGRALASERSQDRRPAPPKGRKRSK